MLDLNNLNSDSDFSRLNDLLNKSLAEDATRKKQLEKEKARQKHLTQLTKDKARQQKILDSNLEELEALEKKVILWEQVCSISHYVTQTCQNCNNTHIYHSSYYHIEKNIKNNLKRLVYTEDIPAIYKIYQTQISISKCIYCEDIGILLAKEEEIEHSSILGSLIKPLGETS